MFSRSVHALKTIKEDEKGDGRRLGDGRLSSLMTWAVTAAVASNALDAGWLSQRAGTNSHGIAGFITPCDSFISGAKHTGRSNVPDWIRTVYHDMAGYNIADGTGGLDASIRFDEEQARAENIGDGFSNTVVTLLLSSNRYVSIADVLAAGVVIAIENCGGPEIAFRGGRADADKPNAPGVPEPQQDLATHIATFARQGFSQTEMIGLVACGCVIPPLSPNHHYQYLEIAETTSKTRGPSRKCPYLLHAIRTHSSEHTGPEKSSV
ncbi:heme peroxidase [Mycena polygramma]|nr:heme peroxidase [Mycena polygramma]